MKIWLLSLCYALPFLSSAQQQFSLNGELKNQKAPIATVYLFYYSKGERKVDSSKVASGKYQFTGALADPTLATLRARYVSEKLKDTYHRPYESDCMHEAIFSHKNQSGSGVHTLDIAKRLIDYGFHPPTIYFPLVVEGAMLIEPTESVGHADLDAFIEAMKDIDREARENPQILHDAPVSTRIGRLDEASAARKPVLRWKKDPETLKTTA